MSNPLRSLRTDVHALDEIAHLVSKITGVQLGEKQRAMVESRIRRRLIQLKFDTIDEYKRYVENNEGSEVPILVSLLTTHHTLFFREFVHFEFLEKSLPQLIQNVTNRKDNALRFWSAACSRGQEVYSLAMFLQHHLGTQGKVSYQVKGTDVDPHSIEIAKNGVYTRGEIKEVPAKYLGSHWSRGTGEISDFVKAKPSIRSACQFEVINLIELPPPGREKFDVIFCRNVFIYFTSEQIKKITSNLMNHLAPGGLLFVGCSETLSNLGLPLMTQGPSIYSLSDLKTKNVIEFPKKIANAPIPKKPEILRVMCVDDSPSILTLLREILKKEHGFEVVATASNGTEAQKKLKEQPVDVMTLDIHMPEQGGLDYLKANFGTHHPPVVMITSVSREDSNLALKAFELGAIDFVEKPALINLAERAEEIRIKLRCAFGSRGDIPSLSIEKSFKKSRAIQSPEKKLRILIANISDRPKFKALFSELEGMQPPTYILFEGSESALDAFSKALQKDIGGNYAVSSSIPDQPGCNQVYTLDFSKSFDIIRKKHLQQQCITFIYEEVSSAALKKLLSWTDARWVIDERIDPSRVPGLRARAVELVPWTSFGYLSSVLFENEKP